MVNSGSYKNIFKTTFLFSFVQIFNILVKVITNKIVAILLGAEGLGIISLFRSSVGLIQTGCGLGISQSAVKDISESNASNEKTILSKIVFVTKRIVLYTGAFGAITTLVLSYWLSIWTFGDSSYTLSYIFLSLSVGLEIMNEGQLAILKGMRRLRYLAYASMIGSIFGLVVVVPIYYFLNKDGIVLSLIVSSLCAYIFSRIFINKIDCGEEKKQSNYDILIEAKPMVKMGVSLMIVSFLGYFSTLIISSFISNYSSLEQVGYFQAGSTIIISYFGIIISAMSTDYYPRIAAINSDNERLQDEVNKQSEVGLILALPIALSFQILAPLFIKILYSNDFLVSLEYTNYAIYGTIIIICSNSMGMILLAKQASKIFLVSTICQRMIFIGVNILLYKFYGIKGLGIAYFLMGLTHFILMSIIMFRFYGIRFTKKIYLYILLALTCSICGHVIQSIQNINLYITFAAISILICAGFSIFKMYNLMHNTKI